MTEDHRYSVSVAGLIVDDEGRALIIQRRDNGHWEPPGGIPEHGETIEDGLRREVHEETGLKVEPGPLTGVYQNMYATSWPSSSDAPPQVACSARAMRPQPSDGSQRSTQPRS